MAYSAELSSWMKNSPYYNAIAGIRTSDLTHSMTMSKKVPLSYPQGHRGGFVLAKQNYGSYI